MGIRIEKRKMKNEEERRVLRDRLVRRGYTGEAADRILSLQGINPVRNDEEMRKHMWNLWSLTGGEIGEEPPEEVMEEWR